MIYEVTLGTRRLRVDIAPDGRFLVDDAVVAADIRELAPARQWSVHIDGSVHEVTLLLHDPMRISVDGVEIAATALDERTLAATRGTRRSGSGRRELRAPMPGLLKAVHVAEGDVVDPGARVMTLEAMKMENELLAPARGRVTRVVVSAGTKVEGGAVLAVLEDVVE